MGEAVLLVAFAIFLLAIRAIARYAQKQLTDDQMPYVYLGWLVEWCATIGVFIVAIRLAKSVWGR